MRKILGLVVAIVLFSAVSTHAFTLSWGAVTKYTDGTLIETSKTVLYNVKMDGILTSAQQTGTSWVFSVSDHGNQHTFEVQTELSTGEQSAWTPPFAWSSPVGEPQSPSGLTITQ